MIKNPYTMLAFVEKTGDAFTLSFYDFPSLSQQEFDQQMKWCIDFKYIEAEPQPGGRWYVHRLTLTGKFRLDELRSIGF